MNKKLKSNIFLFSAPMIWGGAFVAQCMVDVDALGTFAFNAVRFAIGAVFLIPIAILFEKEPHNRDKFKKTVICGAIAGSIVFIVSAFQMYGISINKNSGKSGFLTGLYMVIVPFLNFLFYKKKVRLKEWTAAIIATVGLFLVSVPSGFGSVNFGDVMVLCCAFFSAVHILAIDKFLETVSPIKFSLIQFAACSLLSGICAVFTEDFSVSGVYVNLLPILYTGILSTGVGYTFQVLGQKDANPNFASIVLASEGVYAALAGAVILGETMTLKGYMGCVLMFLGTILSQIELKKSVC